MVGSYYDILGISKNTPNEEIRKAYLKSCLKFHPDKQKNEKDRGDSHEKFTRMSNAYEVLKDPIKRNLYDMKLRSSEANTKPKESDNTNRQSQQEKSGFSQRHQENNSQQKQQSTSNPNENKRQSASQQNKYSSYTSWREYASQDKKQSYTNDNKNEHPFSAGASPPPKSSTSSSNNTGSYSSNFYGGDFPKYWNKPSNTNDNKNEWSNNTGSYSSGYHNDFPEYWKNYGWNSKNGSHNRKEADSDFKNRPSFSAGANTSNSRSSANFYSEYTFRPNYRSGCTPPDSRRYRQPTSSTRSSYKGPSKNTSKNECPFSDASKSPSSQKKSSHHTSSSTRPQKQKSKQSTPTSNEKGKSQPQRLKVFGVRKSDGRPCQRCINQGGYCYQHTGQDPLHKQNKYDYNHSNAGTSPLHNQQQPNSTKAVYGKRKSDGKTCKRCVQQGGFCTLHKDQIYGIRADGQPCLRCIKQKQFCYQHKFQQKI